MEITHRARQICADDFERFHHIVVMDRSNLANVLALARNDAHRAKVRLFRAFEAGAAPESEVPDPYYTGEFARVFEICEAASAGLLAHLREHHTL